MKFYIKVFVIWFFIFAFIFAGAMYAYSKYFVPVENLKPNNLVERDKKVDFSKFTELEKLNYESKRINFLLFGTDGGRSDTMMFASYDTENQSVDIISLPRDTVIDFNVDGVIKSKKLNSVIGYSGDNGGLEGLKEQIYKIIGLPVDYYIRVEYDGIMNIVDEVGGVEIEVPFRMKYDDTAADPPLHIDLEPGLQKLSGEQAIQFLRWRKNNGEGGKGDIPRTERQQYFIRQLLKKSIGLKLPKVIGEAFDNVETDLTLSKALVIGSKFIGIDMADVVTHTLPGAPGDPRHGYYVYDPEKTQELMLSIFSPKKSEEHEETAE